MNRFIAQIEADAASFSFHGVEDEVSQHIETPWHRMVLTLEDESGKVIRHVEAFASGQVTVGATEPKSGGPAPAVEPAPAEEPKAPSLLLLKSPNPPSLLLLKSPKPPSLRSSLLPQSLKSPKTLIPRLKTSLLPSQPSQCRLFRRLTPFLIRTRSRRPTSLSCMTQRLIR